MLSIDAIHKLQKERKKLINTWEKFYKKCGRKPCFVGLKVGNVKGSVVC